MSATDKMADGWVRPRWRLRDLRDRDLLSAIGLAIVVLTPFVVALARAFHDGWVPSGDEANIATRALDVFSRHPPLTGLPSTSGLYGAKFEANHPGPIEFYLLAIPLRLLGRTSGPLLTAAAINGACCFVALWVIFRRLGSTAMLWAGVVLLAVIWSAGTAVLTDTLSSNMPLYSLLATAVLTWSLIDGDLRLLPLTALVASYAAQQHLAATLVVTALMAVAAVALARQVIALGRRGDTEVTATARRWSLAALAVATVCWFPVAVDELTGHPGNVTAIVRFARDSTRQTVGLDSGLDQTLHAVTPPTMLTRTDTTGFFFLHALGPYRFALGIAVVVALGVVAWGARVRCAALARLAFVAMALLAVGVVNGSNVPVGYEMGRVNLYRWAWATAFVTWMTLGIAVVLVLGRIAGAHPLARRVSRLGPPALLLVAALIASAVVFVHGDDDHNREQPGFAAERHIGPAVLAAVDRHRPVVVIGDGFAAEQSIAPYVFFRLAEAGTTVLAPSSLTSTYGNWRRYGPRSGASGIVVTSGTTRLASVPGRLLATWRFGPERTALLNELSAAALGKKVELAAGADTYLARRYPGLIGIYTRRLIVGLRTNPRASFEQPAFLRLLERGILRSPAIDLHKVARLLTLSPERNTLILDEQVEVHLLTPDQLRGWLAATPPRQRSRTRRCSRGRRRRGAPRRGRCAGRS